ncbi:peptidoglycan-binding domain-containing protein [Thermomonas fusca]|uniref:Peptidoglycan-binding protein n=1 Tax=Thermomonas fusca TaxID=215690 RepID=A0A5R9PCT9_9GAMM|nr:peptidoglycan-binding domain-containing protein [Thermomonas fusca]TLX20853.1 peptidoglycan-binding protein [Thermomonas fusca]
MTDPVIVKVTPPTDQRRTFQMSDGSIVVRDGGTVAWRNNNPGNLKFEYKGDADQTHNVARSKEQALASAQRRYDGVVDLDQWGNAIFATPQQGRAAKIKLLTNNGDLTVKELLPKYSTADYSGNTNHAAQEQAIYAVGDARGVNLRGKRISQMTPTEIAALADGIGKFEGMRVGTESVVRAPSAQATAVAKPALSQEGTGQSPGIQLTAAYAMGVKYDDVKYAINVPGHRLFHPGVSGKDLSQGYIDCSGWVSHLQNATMFEINEKSGREVFSKADRLYPNMMGSGAIVKLGFDRSKILLNDAQVRAGTDLKEGMVIGVDSGRTRHEHWKGIDHIVMVVRDPQSGVLLASQSSGSKGVHSMPLAEYLRGVPASYTLVASDPLAKARGLLQGKVESREQAPANPAPNGRAQQAAPGNGSARDGLLERNDSGPAVVELQKRLNALGYGGKDGYQLRGTGNFGANTESAVREFQRAHGLAVDGIAGPKTLAALERSVAHPLLCERAHPNNGLYQAIASRLPAGTRREVIANVVVQATVNGITDASKLRDIVQLDNGAVLVRGTTIGAATRVDLDAPTPGFQAMSEHLSRESAQRQQQAAEQEQRRQQQPVLQPAGQ